VANDLKHGENYISKWFFADGASAEVFVPFFESITKELGYQRSEETEIVPEPDTFVIKLVRCRCRNNSRVVFRGDVEGVIPTSFAKEGGYIRKDHLRIKGDIYYYCA
jgi:hypothetical protein